jgi:hypothetical protein
VQNHNKQQQAAEIMAAARNAFSTLLIFDSASKKIMGSEFSYSDLYGLKAPDAARKMRSEAHI